MLDLDTGLRLHRIDGLRKGCRAVAGAGDDRELQACGVVFHGSPDGCSRLLRHGSPLTQTQPGSWREMALAPSSRSGWNFISEGGAAACACFNYRFRIEEEI